MPKVYVIDDPAPNAFAVGTSPQKASIAFTTGLLSMMNRAELEGVAAHELSHTVKDTIRAKLPRVLDVTIHIEPHAQSAVSD